MRHARWILIVALIAAAGLSGCNESKVSQVAQSGASKTDQHHENARRNLDRGHVGYRPVVRKPPVPACRGAERRLRAEREFPPEVRLPAP